MSTPLHRPVVVGPPQAASMSARRSPPVGGGWGQRCARADDYEARRRVRAAFRAALCVMPIRLRVAASRCAAARGERSVPRRARAEVWAWRDSEECDAAQTSTKAEPSGPQSFLTSTVLGHFARSRSQDAQSYQGDQAGDR